MIEQGWNFIAHQLAHNQFFSGGALAAALGFGLAWLRFFPLWLWGTLKKQILVSGKINNTDEIWGYAKSWIWRRSNSFWSKHWTVQTLWRAERLADGTTTTVRDMVFLPAPGRHFFFVGWRLYWVDVTQNEPKERFQDKVFESATFWTFGRTPTLIKGLYQQMWDEHKADYKEDVVKVFINGGTHWDDVQPLLPRSPDTVFLPQGMWEEIHNDAAWFIKNRDWYRKRSIPWRRGFLLHGIPGAGKSTTVLTLAAHLKMSIYVLNLGICNDAVLPELMSSIEDRAILLIEDVDTTAPTRDRKESVVGSVTPLTLAGLLNVLDGVTAREGIIVCMTTNHPESIDAALIRPGRIDRQFHLGVTNAEQAARFLAAFYEIDPTAACGAATTMQGTSMAQLQEHCLKHRDSLGAAVATWKGALVV